jgi:hypothetical protein
MWPRIDCRETSIGLRLYFLINFFRTFCTLEYVVPQSAQNVEHSDAFYTGTLE